MKLLRRKIDHFFEDWKADPERKPLIIKGARQIGKTESVRRFGRTSYDDFLEINFILQKEYRSIFDDGYDVDRIIQNITLIRPEWKPVPGETLVFFDEIQACTGAATALKSFRQDGRFDVICSGSLMGINYQEIESNSVGNKDDVTMYAMDFEEYLWARGYTDDQIASFLEQMIRSEPLSQTAHQVMQALFHEFMILGGMPEIVNRFVKSGNFGGILQMQRQIILDYEEDITKYAGGLDRAKILNVYRSIPVFLGKENKKFQISKVAHGARNREYTGVVEWLDNAGIVNICYCMHLPELPLKGNCDPDHFKLYFGDTGLLIASLDDEAQQDLRDHRNFNAYKGAIYENVIAETLKKQGYGLYFYKNQKATLEMDFFIRDTKSLIPVEVKATNGATVSLNHLINKDRYADISYGIKFFDGNIGFDGRIYSFPYSLAFLLRRFMKERME